MKKVEKLLEKVLTRELLCDIIVESLQSGEQWSLKIEQQEMEVET